MRDEEDELLLGLHVVLFSSGAKIWRENPSRGSMSALASLRACWPGREAEIDQLWSLLEEVRTAHCEARLCPPCCGGAVARLVRTCAPRAH